MEEHNLKNIAIIDIGSNTVRLVIYQISRLYNFTQLQNVKLPVRLYQYLDAEKKLSDEGIQKLEEVIRLFQEILTRHQIDELIATATAVIRQARNQEKILQTIKEDTGLSLRLLSDQEEAFYGQYAVARTTRFSEGYTVDMGGGSTEITYFKDNEILHSHSFPFGVVTLKNLFFNGKAHNDKKAIEKAQRYLREQFSALSWLQKRGLPIIAVGGSSRNIASVHQIQTHYPISGIHGYEMDQKDLETTSKLFQRLSMEELQNLDGLSRDRADIILPANLTFSVLYQLLDAEKFVFCNKGLREGLLIERINQELPDTYDPYDVVGGVITRLTETYGINVYSATKRMNAAKLLLEALQKEDFIRESAALTQYLYYAAFLYHVGSYIEEDDSSMHSFYLIANSNLNGFTHKERVALALLASYKNKTLFTQYIASLESWFTERELTLIKQAGSLIKFSEALNITQVNEIIALDFKKADKKSYRLAISWSYDPLAETYRANRQKKNLEMIIGKKILIDFTKN